MQIDQVAEIIRRVGTQEVVGRFRSLADHEVTEKSPGDLVTIADRECERLLTSELQSLRDLPVVGEEAAAHDPGLLDLVDSAPAVWVVDPIDGTTNFVNGDTRFAIMVALVEAGAATAAWVWHPETDTMWAAQSGVGTFRNHERILAGALDRKPKGILKAKYVPEPARSRMRQELPGGWERVPALRCAGLEYAALVAGELDFLFYWRTLPWDHTPGSLLAHEAGLRVGRLDGSPYTPGDDRRGLLTAHPDIWEPLAAALAATLSG